MSKKDHDKPIRSAMATAALRAASTAEKDSKIANPDHLAQVFVTGLYKRILSLPYFIKRPVIELMSPGSYCYFLGRTHFFDHHFSSAVNKGIKQFIIPGAGYDTRAARILPQNSNATVFEIDLPCTQKYKIEKFKKADIKCSSNVVYIGTDFNDSSFYDLLAVNNFDFSQPVTILLEGVSYYIEEKSVREIFSFLSKHCAQGSEIVFDYSLQSFVNGIANSYGAKSMIKWLKKNNEPFKFGINPLETNQFIAGYNLFLQEDINPNELVTKYMSSTAKSIGKPLGYLRLAKAVKP